jgi:hypothetical protein
MRSRSRRVGIVVSISVVLFCLPTWASAQGTAGIAGTVTDETGGALPGVTVEGRSPALLEQVRTVVSDGAGEYRIVALQPGTYTVTFSLPGFSVFQREEIQLTTGFTATVDAELAVGTLEETITVTGLSPIVDVQTVSRQEVMTRDVVDSLPLGRNFQEMATLIPGVQMFRNDGGSGAGITGMGGSGGVDGFKGLRAHGSRGRDTRLEVNGLNVNVFASRQDSSYLKFQDGNVQEYSYEIQAHSAESETGGVVVNMIPKEGSNVYSGGFYVDFSNNSLQSSNMNDELRDAGLREPNAQQELWKVNPYIGGPLVQDRVWFYAAAERFVTQRFVTDVYENLTPAAWTPTIDLTQQAVTGERTYDVNGRLTWQAAAKHKLSFYYDQGKLCQCPYSLRPGTSPEASNFSPRWTKIFQANWIAPVTNRLLFEAGVSLPWYETDRTPRPESTEGRFRESTLATAFRASHPAINFDDQNVNHLAKGSFTYVTGSHAFKVGASVQFGRATTEYFNVVNMDFATSNFRPRTVTFHSTPYSPVADHVQTGFFAQDQWTLDRLSLNLGIRYDYYNQSYPDHTLPAVEFIPVARTFPADDLVRWHDISPRVGVAYDLFGSGKTALKANLGRFIEQHGLITSRPRVHPARINATMRRVWTDPNGDFIIQGDPLNPAANEELGPSQNLNFGSNVVTDKFDDDYAFGFGSRSFSWEASVGIDHTLLSNVSLNASFLRRAYGNLRVDDSLFRGPADYDPYCVTAPVDSRLPNGGGYEICDLYDLNPLKVGQTDTSFTSSENFGDMSEIWQGLDVTTQIRYAGGFLQGGFSTGKTSWKECDVIPKIDNPSTRFCDRATPYLTSIKLGGSFTAPGDVQLAATVQSFPGVERQANHLFRNAAIAPSLGRNLSTGTRADIPLLEPFSDYNDRITQLDMRITKIFALNDVRLRAMVDIYNLVNAGTVTSENQRFGSTWLFPRSILDGRLVRFGVQLDF